MTDWQSLYARRDWDALDDWWRYESHGDEARKLFERLQADVPRCKRENGMEAIQDFMRPDEAPEQWKGAAEILYLGELEAMVEGEPKPEPEIWRERRRKIEATLQSASEADEVTEGDPSLSRAAHAKEALDALESVDWCCSAMIQQVAAKDRKWLQAFAEEITALAFHAGVETRAALGKAVEADAVRGKKVITAASQGGRMRVQSMSPRTKEIIAFMKTKVGRGTTVRSAASLAEKAGLGASIDANLKLWNRHHKK